MSKYLQLKTWKEFQSEVFQASSVAIPKMTDFIDLLLLKGGKVKELHSMIKKEQDKRGSKGYHSIGFLFNRSGDVQKRTFFGHIALLIVDEKCMIEFGGKKIDALSNKNTLKEKYSNNAYIRIEGFREERRKDSNRCATDTILIKKAKLGEVKERLSEKPLQKKARGSLNSTTGVGVNASSKINELIDMIDTIVQVKTYAFGQYKTIYQWVLNIRKEIIENRKLLYQDNGASKIKVTTIFLRDIIQKGVRGETCLKVQELLDERIKVVDDLNTKNFQHILRNSGYRFPNDFTIWDQMVKCINNEFNWNWKQYIDAAEKEYRSNFKNDPFLKISGIGYNVRNLALSNFSPYFPKIDKHIGEVFQRLDIPKVLIGRDIPKSWYTTERMQPLFVMIADNYHRKYSETDLDRIFWHFGKSICKNPPICGHCPVNEKCKFCSI